MIDAHASLLALLSTAPLNLAERHLVSTARLGVGCVANEGTCLVIRAEVLSDLVTGVPLDGQGVQQLHPSGIELKRAIIVGKEFNLEGARLLAALWLQDCVFASAVSSEAMQLGICRTDARYDSDGVINLGDARGTTVAIRACRLSNIKAQRLHLSGKLYLDHSKISGGVEIRDSQIDEHVWCKGTWVGGKPLRPLDSPHHRASDCTPNRIENPFSALPTAIPDDSSPASKTFAQVFDELFGPSQASRESLEDTLKALAERTEARWRAEREKVLSWTAPPGSDERDTRT